MRDTKRLLFSVQVLPDEYSRDMCVRFADMESKLGEIDRSRAIYIYCSQICDPRVRGVFSMFSSNRHHFVLGGGNLLALTI